MGTIAASAITSRAQKILLDETGVTWSPAELLDYLNAGITTIVSNKPDAYTSTRPHLMVPGSKQSLPANAVQIVDVVCNLGVNGTTRGRAIRQVERTSLDLEVPDWHGAVGPLVKHWVGDQRDPLTFWTYPTPTTAWNVEVVVAEVPPRLAAIGETIPVSDVYESPLTHWVLAHAYAKNTKRGDLGKSQAYLALFASAIGAKTAVQFQFASGASDTPGQKDR